MTGEPPAERWVAVAQLEELPRGGRREVEVEGTRIALFHLDDGALRAVDLACPHAGYSLLEADVEGHQVTCPLHNWVLSLDDGTCLFGARDTRSYPVRLDGDRVMLALPLHDQQAEATLLASMRHALAISASDQLEQLVEHALDQGVELERVLMLARGAATSHTLEALAALDRVRAEMPDLSRGDQMLAALRWAAESSPAPLPALDLRHQADPERLRGESPRHLRRRVLAAIERGDESEALDAAASYMTDEACCPIHLAEDLVRAGLEAHAALFTRIAQACTGAYRWDETARTRVLEAISLLVATRTGGDGS